MTDIPYNTEHARGRTDVYGQSMLFHCNHYNRSHQQYIEDPQYVDSEAIFLRSAAETAYRQTQAFHDARPDSTFEETLAFAEDVFSFGGFGRLDFSEVGMDGGTVYSDSSHYGSALKLNVGEREEPGEFFDRGFVAGVLLAAGQQHDLPLGDGFDIDQPTSISLGDDTCEYVIDTDGDFQWLELLEEYPVEDRPTIPEPAASNIDEAQIIEDVRSLDLTGNEQGLIPQFGVTLTRGYADYYNKTSFRFARAVEDELGDIDFATEMLVEAGHICGFNTMGGIMASPEWDGVVAPMIETHEDWLHGIVATINALGWGVWRVHDLEPEERAVFRIYDPYESVGHLRWFGKSDYPVDFVAEGVASALMNLLYYGDITGNPTLDEEYYYELFEEKGGFDSEQTASVAMGDEYTEVVVTK